MRVRLRLMLMHSINDGLFTIDCRTIVIRKNGNFSHTRRRGMRAQVSWRIGIYLSKHVLKWCRVALSVYVTTFRRRWHARTRGKLKCMLDGISLE